MADDSDGSPLGCLLFAAVALLMPAGVIAAVIWPDQTANQFAGRTLLIAGGFVVAFVVVVLSFAVRGRR